MSGLQRTLPFLEPTAFSLGLGHPPGTLGCVLRQVWPRRSCLPASVHPPPPSTIYVAVSALTLIFL